MSTSKLFQTTKVGNVTLDHRVVMAPLTRFRANDFHVPSVLAAEYYTQRGSTPGTLLVSEATFISAKAGGYGNVPGIWSDEQISEWKKVGTSFLTYFFTILKIQIRSSMQYMPKAPPYFFKYGLWDVQRTRSN